MEKEAIMTKQELRDEIARLSKGVEIQVIPPKKIKQKKVAA